MVQAKVIDMKDPHGGKTINYKYQLRCLLNKVNRVTSAHRHGQTVSIKDLDALSNRQIEIEELTEGD
jgi:hypothetical protein